MMQQQTILPLPVRRVGARAILRVNLKFLSAMMALGFGWICWEMSSKVLWGYGVIAILAFAAGTLAFIGAGAELWRQIARDRELQRFSRSGQVVMGDPVADEETLRNQGLID